MLRIRKNRSKIIPSTCDIHSFKHRFRTSKKWPPSLFTRCGKKLRYHLLKESRIPVEIEDIEVLLKALIVDPEDAIVKVCGILRVVVEMCLEFWGPVPAQYAFETVKKIVLNLYRSLEEHIFLSVTTA